MQIGVRDIVHMSVSLQRRWTIHENWMVLHLEVHI